MACCVLRKETDHGTRYTTAMGFFYGAERVNQTSPQNELSPFLPDKHSPQQFVGRITQGVINAFGFADRDDITD